MNKFEVTKKNNFSSLEIPVILSPGTRIDNREELVIALNLPDSTFTDVQLIFSAYRKWGVHCPEHFLGDFAFLLWDEVNAQFYGAVDHVGIKRLYYHFTPEWFSVGFRIRELLTMAHVTKQVNESKIASLLTLFPCHEPTETYYKDIFQLPPGHFMIVTQEGLSIQRYWALDPSKNIQLESDEAYAEAFREIFTEAVRCRLDGEHPLGIRLSGGIDSVSVAALAREILDENYSLHTFSAYFAGSGDTDERPYINDLLALGSYQAHFIDGNQINPLEDIADMLAQHDEPVYNHFAWVDWRLNKLAKEKGVRVILDGIDGDGTVAPIGFRDSYLPELLHDFRLRSFWSEVRGHARQFGTSLFSTLLIYGVKPFVPQSVLDFRDKIRGQFTPNPLIPDIINPDFAKSMKVIEKFKSAGGYYWLPQKNSRLAHYLQARGRYEEGRVQMMHLIASPFGVECRHPFADVRLMEFCLAIPSAQKLYRGLNRIVMRRALSDLLPQSTYHRPGKAGLAGNYMKPFYQAVIPHVVKKIPDLQPYVDPQAFKKSVGLYTQQGDASEHLNIALTVTLALWLFPEIGESVAAEHEEAKKKRRT